MPATVADPNRSLDSEQISPATIAHHTVYEKTPNLHQSHICQWGAQPYLVGPLSRLVGKPPLSPWVSTNVLPLTQVGNNTNSAISLTEIFDRVFSDVCNSVGFEVQKQKKWGSGNNRVYRNLKTMLYSKRMTEIRDRGFHTGRRAMGLELRSCSGLPTSGGTSANGDSGVGEWWDCNVPWPVK